MTSANSVKVLIITATARPQERIKTCLVLKYARSSRITGYQEIHSLILPDEEEQICQTVRDHCDRGAVDWIITTGGTGFGAITPLIERHAPGLVHLLLSASIKHTPFAALSRPVAGTVKNTLVVNTPWQCQSREGDNGGASL
ncbi:MoaB/Mog domain-containing protein [Chiua virens]|nr:MoaB/Mog domain-containing protein [Chiua virens]